MLQEGSLLEFLENTVKNPFCKDIAVKSEEQWSSKLKSINWPAGEELPFDGLFSKLVNFSSYVGMLVGFEKEIIYLFFFGKQNQKH